jgi:Rrf2 family transcriptional regulator, nitric oxide-sensitive transcriptional repressor
LADVNVHNRNFVFRASAPNWLASVELFALLDKSTCELDRIVGERNSVFSQTVEYALRAVVFLAGKPFESGVPQNSEQIANATKVPHAYLSKVLKQLTDSEIILSRRGANGGFVLSLAPDELTILEVVNAVDPIQRINKCPLGLSSHGIRLCPLHSRMMLHWRLWSKRLRRRPWPRYLQTPTRASRFAIFPNNKNPRRLAVQSHRDNG